MLKILIALCMAACQPEEVEVRPPTEITLEAGYVKVWTTELGGFCKNWASQGDTLPSDRSFPGNLVTLIPQQISARSGGRASWKSEYPIYISPEGKKVYLQISRDDTMPFPLSRVYPRSMRDLVSRMTCPLEEGIQGAPQPGEVFLYAKDPKKLQRLYNYLNGIR